MGNRCSGSGEDSTHYLVPCEIDSGSACEENVVSIYADVFCNVDKFADKIAFIDTLGDTERSITFGQLRDRVRSISKGLLAKGYKRGDVIGLFGPNSIDWICIAHGIMMIGATLAPVNPTYEPRELLHHLTEGTEGDSTVKAVFTMPTASFKDRVIEVQGQYQHGKFDVLYVMGGDADGLEDLIENGQGISDEDLALATNAIDAKNDIAMLPSSSGTTGPPKCVELTHASFATNIEQSAMALAYTDEDITVTFLPFFHMFGLCLFCGFGIRAGMKTTIMPKFDAKKYMELIGREKPTTLAVVPPVANVLAKIAPEGLLDSVKSVLCAAAPLTKEQEANLQVKLKNGLVIQGYGMTELSPVATMASIGTSELRGMAAARTGTVGPLVPGTKARLVKVEGEDDPKRGLLQIKGPQVMKGYRNRKEQTEKTILADGWLDTGDVAVVDKAGYFWIVDRVKELIKCKGFQVAPAELEGLIITQAQVKEVCVIGVSHDKMGEVAKAFLSLKPESATVAAEALFKDIDEHMQKQGISDYKRLFGGVEIVEAVRQTASGKLLRKEYRALEKQRAAGSESQPDPSKFYVPPLEAKSEAKAEAK